MSNCTFHLGWTAGRRGIRAVMADTLHPGLGCTAPPFDIARRALYTGEALFGTAVAHAGRHDHGSRVEEACR